MKEIINGEEYLQCDRIPLNLQEQPDDCLNIVRIPHRVSAGVYSAPDKFLHILRTYLWGRLHEWGCE